MNPGDLIKTKCFITFHRNVVDSNNSNKNELIKPNEDIMLVLKVVNKEFNSKATVITTNGRVGFILYDDYKDLYLETIQKRFVF